jgi:hypothetical protein
MLESIPPGANITADGVHIGSTPLKHSISPSAKPVEFVFSNKGFVTERLWAVPTPGLRLRAELERIPSIQTPTKRSNQVQQKASSRRETDIKFER